MDKPHGDIVDDQNEVWNMWCGTRRTDNQTTAIGFYRFYPAPSQDDADALRLEFRPLLSGLPHEQAVFFAETFAQEMDGDMGKLKALTEVLSEMSENQRAALIEEIGRSTSFDHLPNFEL